MEVGHTKFWPDAGFGLIRQCSQNFDTETIPVIVQISNSSTPISNSNIGVEFSNDYFKKRLDHERYRTVRQMRKQHMIQFARIDGEANTLLRKR